MSVTVPSKTSVFINGQTICTQWKISPEILKVEQRTGNPREFCLNWERGRTWRKGDGVMDGGG